MFIPGCLAILALPIVSRAADPVIPQPPQLDHYQSIWQNSPFGKPSAKDASETYTLVSFFKIGNVSYATLIEKQSNKKLFISSNPASSSDISLVSTSPNVDPLASSVTILKDGEQMIVKFDPTTVKAAPTAVTVNQPENNRGGPPGIEFFRNMMRRRRMINNEPGEGFPFPPPE